MKKTLLKALLVLLVWASAGSATLFPFRFVLARTIGCEFCGNRPAEDVTAQYGNGVTSRSRVVYWRVCTGHASNLPEELSEANLSIFFSGVFFFVTPLILLFYGQERLLKNEQLAAGIIHGSVTLWCIAIMASGLYADLRMLFLWTAVAVVGTIILVGLAIHKLLKIPLPQGWCD